MRGNPKGAETFSYYCPPPNQGGCGKASIQGPKTDAMVTALVLARMGSATAEVVTDFDGADELAEKQSRIGELMAAFTAGTVTGTVAFPSIQVLERDVAVLRDRQRAHDAARGATTTTPTAWPNLDVSQRREVVGAHLQAVLVRPAHTKGGRFNPERVEPVWR
jgi:hypothetical protein